ncbi:MAG: heme ABC transporter permease [Pyrinomonas sp.]|uniref:FecCD family ABC transporter permease n=1 Tax=Pyrinomonas sp. TaxID=2080306 RepID=UPI00332009D5
MQATERLVRTRRNLIVLLTVLFIVVALFSLSVGPAAFTPHETLAILARKLGLDLAVDGRQEAVFLAIRLPRVLLGALVGAGLATAGAVMQGIFRNPLADPGLVGVSSGAALGAVAAIVIGGGAGFALRATAALFFVPCAAFAGGLITTAFVLVFARMGAATMLLAGIAINALSGSAIGFLTYIATDAQLRDIAFWSLGSLSGATWTTLLAVAPFVLTALLLLPRVAGALNALLLGEAEAAHLGVAVESVKRRAVVLVALSVGASVAFTGAIGFIGLVTPHLLRLIIGPDHRWLLPGTALFGACLLLVADATTRTLVAPAELPVGVVTALVGAPFFLWLLARNRRRSS